MPGTKKRLITAEDLYRFELINHVRLSPDGDTVIYLQKRVDPKTQKKYSNLWVVSTKQGKPRQFTYGDQNDVKHTAGKFPGILQVILFFVLGEQGDEGRGDGTQHQQVVNQVWDAKGGIINIQIVDSAPSGRPKGLGQQMIAEYAQETAKESRKGQKQGRGQ